MESGEAVGALAPSPRRVRRARLALIVFFVGMGTMLGTHVSRIPSVRDGLGVSPAQLALLFIAGSLGALLGFSLLGGLVARLGALRLFRLATVAVMAGFATMGLATHLGLPPLFAAANFVTLGAFETINALSNAEAATVERLVGRSILAQFHAAFSLAVLAGVGLGALYSSAGVAVVWHFTANVAVVGVVYLALSRTAILDGAPAAAGSAEAGGGLFITLRLAARERRTLALGLIVFCAFTIEMSANNWVPLSVVDDFGRTEAVAATLFVVFVIAQSAVRLVGGRLVDRVGRVIVLRCCAASAAAGVLVFAFTPGYWGVPVALVLWGLGASLGYPLAISGAADARDNATARVGAVAAFGTVAGLTMPQVVGLLGEVVELRRALLVLVVVAAGMFALAPAARPPAAAPVPVSEDDAPVA
ncbi:MFS transporter [Demequina pelophila]|uniref:MFS transporter n=1 Tax=Demequina pelophila TaxID=1638984 RepID=UPI0007822D61|nr:MFS transporter [Demequina pelophila]